MDNKALKAILCGYERGGTTMLSQMVVSHPKLATGFEGGLLLAPKPSDFLKPQFAPFNDSMIRNGWGVSGDDVRYIVDTEDWNEVYSRLRERAAAIQDKSAYLVDKTPKYMEVLDKVLSRKPDVPCVVIIKEPKGVIWSWLKRQPGIDLANISLELVEQLCARYESYARGYRRAMKLYPERILTVDYAVICQSPEPIAKAIFNHLGFDFDPSYLVFEKKYEVHANTVVKDYLSEYEQGLNTKLQSFIDKKTRKALQLLWG